jgi:plastocyanin
MATIFPGSASVNQEFNGYRFDGTTWDIIGINLTADYLENSTASATYLTQLSASSLYLSQSSASANYATKEYADSSSSAAAAALIDAAPSTLNTLNELAAALNDDANFASTVSTSLGNKLDISSASTIYATKTELSNVPTTFNGATDATLAGISINEIAYSAITRLEVTSSGTTAYLMNNQYSGNNPTIYVTAGTTIAFNLNVTGHPFLIKTAGGAANYDTGLIHVATDGTVTTGSSAQGKVSGTLYWQVPSSISGPYAYQCSIHSGMLGVITITSPSPTSFTSLSAPTLRLSSTIDATDNTNNWGFQVGATNGENIRIDNNEILALNNDVNSVLNIQRHGGQVLVGGSVLDGSSVGLEVHGPLRLESSRSAANNTRGTASMEAKIVVSSTDNRQELQIYSSGDAYSTGSRGAGIQMYGTDDSQHAGNITFLTGPPDQGNARIIVAGGTGTTGYVSGGTTYTRTNTDTRVTIGNSLWDWVDEKNDTGLLNLKDASSRPAIYVLSSGSVDGTTFGTIGIETGTSFGIGHWSGTDYTNRLSIDSTGIVSIPGILDVAEVRETVVSNSFSTNVMTANYNDGAIHYATVAPTGNFTISLTNVPTTTSKSITMSFLVTQGATGYIPTTLNLNGSSQTIRWVGGSAPTPTSSAGKIDIFNFTLILAASNVVIASANLNI